MGEERKEVLLENALDWAIENGSRIMQDMLRATGITSDELDEMGYDREYYPKMYEAVDPVI